MSVSGGRAEFPGLDLWVKPRPSRWAWESSAPHDIENYKMERTHLGSVCRQRQEVGKKLYYSQVKNNLVKQAQETEKHGQEGRRTTRTPVKTAFQERGWCQSGEARRTRRDELGVGALSFCYAATRDPQMGAAAGLRAERCPHLTCVKRSLALG